MDKDFIQKVALVAVVLGAVLIFYFEASPLQQCLKTFGAERPHCYQWTSW